MFAVTERLLSKNKSTFSMLLHTHFLKAAANLLQYDSKKIVAIILQLLAAYVDS